ncbi:MAG: FAD-dependent monooxygenase [Candidatus Pacebacteria bacterium]|nr:FAD-dependent monooxygenase [Candidatus Paceibacterota bacterium]
MNKNDAKQSNWTICPECHGLGRIARNPSRRRLYLYQIALATFKMNPDTEVEPKPLHKNMDVCFPCAGSGLVASDCVTPIHAHYPHVAIIGGGIGGVALAVACLHRGIPFTLYERDQSFNARSQGYGLTLQQASKAIEGLGIFSLDGAITSTRHVVHNPDGKIIGEWGLRKWKKPQLEGTSQRRNVHIARQSLRLALIDQLRDSTSIKWNHTLIGFSENNNGGINLDFQVGDKRETATADLVVGADGIRSVVRTLVIDEHETPMQYLGCIVILGICPLKSLGDIESPLLDSATVFQTVNGHERMYVMPFDKDTIMWQFSFPIPEDEAKELSAKGQEAMKQEALQRLGTWHSPIPEMLSATLATDITGYPVYDRKILDATLLQDAGNITIIGDAAHPMSPFKGQGANQALLDALALARKISTVCGPDSNWREIGLRKMVLTEFEKEMIKRTTAKVEGSAKAVELLHSDAVLHEGDEPRGRGLNIDQYNKKILPPKL